jgi:hypothetical protein
MAQKGAGSIMGVKFPTPRKRARRALLAAGVALAGAVGLMFTQVTPALADPTTTLVAVGSDTTQDLYKQFALDLNSTLLGPWDAVNTVTGAAHEIITPTDGTAAATAPPGVLPAGTVPNPLNPTGACSFQRPDGSTEGVEALEAALGAATPLTGTAIPQSGCVDIATSSSGPGTQNPAGALIYIPFAADGVAGATGGTAAQVAGVPAYNYTYTEASTIGTTNTQNMVSAQPVATNITHANLFTEVDLLNLYANCQPVTEGGVTYWPLGSPAAQPPGSTVIDLYLPPAGSSTATFWARTFGNFNPNSLPSCVHQTIVGGPLATATGGVPVVEHDGTPMATDPNGFGPFSIAQWISQFNGHNDRRHTAVVQPLVACSAPITVTSTCGGAPIAPYTGTATLALNTNFPITRQVYSVAPYARVTDPADPLFGLLDAGSIQDTLCNDFGAISSYGFGPNPNCGAVLAANRAGPTLVTVAVNSNPNPSTVGQAVTVTATVTPAGATGSIQFYINGVPAGGMTPIAAGTATGTATFNKAGTYRITAAYIPTGNFAAPPAVSTTQTVN